jgi:Arc/MetJ family transcription regulator
MRTNIEIDDRLMAQAQRASGLKTKRAVVEEALRTLIRLRKQRDVARIFGKFKVERVRDEDTVDQAAE